MQNKSKLQLILGLFLLLILAMTIIKLKKNSYCKKLDCVQFIDKQKYQLTKIYHQDDSNGFKALYSNVNTLLRVNIFKNINEKDAQTKINAQAINIKNLYSNARSPYPGEISDEIQCSDEYKPTFSNENINGLNIYILTSYLNNRLVPGVCNKQQIKHSSYLISFYCPQQQILYQTEFIYPINSDNAQSKQEITKSIGCT